MRELRVAEIEKVSGGFGLVGAGIGAAIGVAGALSNGAPASRVVAAGLFGGLSGAAGNLAASAAAGGLVIRSVWGVRAIGTGVISGATASGGGSSDSADPDGDS